MSALGTSAVRMANEIARNFAVNGDDEAARQTANYIQTQWNPALIAALGETPPEQLSAIARKALLIVQKGANLAQS